MSRVERGDGQGRAARRAARPRSPGAGRAGWPAEKRGEIATLVGRGLDGLDAYFTGYLPQLVLGVTVPIAVLARLVFADWTSAVIVAVTLPLIPIFGALVGWQAQAATERQWRRLSMLGGHFLDMVAGLPTLRAFGRAKAQVEVVRRMADRHRIATMKTLRIAFLSALVLELVATLSVALVAVPIGLRLLAGGLTLQTALLVLLLAPGGVPAAARGGQPVPREPRRADRAGRGADDARRRARAGDRGHAGWPARRDRLRERHRGVRPHDGAARRLT